MAYFLLEDVLIIDFDNTDELTLIQESVNTCMVLPQVTGANDTTTDF